MRFAGLFFSQNPPPPPFTLSYILSHSFTLQSSMQKKSFCTFNSHQNAHYFVFIHTSKCKKWFIKQKKTSISLLFNIYLFDISLCLFFELTELHDNNSDHFILFFSLSLSFSLRFLFEMLSAHNERVLEEKTNQFCAELFVKSIHRVWCAFVKWKSNEKRQPFWDYIVSIAKKKQPTRLREWIKPKKWFEKITPHWWKANWMENKMQTWKVMKHREHLFLSSSLLLSLSLLLFSFFFKGGGEYKD